MNRKASSRLAAANASADAHAKDRAADEQRLPGQGGVPGEIAQCDLWFPPDPLPLGFGSVNWIRRPRVAFATAAEWVARLAAAHHAGRLQAEIAKLGRIPSRTGDQSTVDGLTDYLLSRATRAGSPSVVLLACPDSPVCRALLPRLASMADTATRVHRAGVRNRPASGTGDGGTS